MANTISTCSWWNRLDCPHLTERADYVAAKRVGGAEERGKRRDGLAMIALHQQVQRLALNRRVSISQRTNEHDLSLGARQTCRCSNSRFPDDRGLMARQLRYSPLEGDHTAPAQDLKTCDHDFLGNTGPEAPGQHLKRVCRKLCECFDCGSSLGRITLA
jgi:hypothetical protein